ncbi:aldehyde dehydrogenase family protein [Eilatimonas milleporae]|uniref:Aldehyde dehydrogenase (NAD+) n=1 Tax=Eilatimonas milleporae TaxID=911205 RepID=A0A3M0BY93_9PROT|nr:aldehyde dehydrogenase family protein [Eilatimonas milleporae]RMB02002.1 aldehyde dehydrogenase (NAD+) [Eilatimonas milleporae]
METYDYLWIDGERVRPSGSETVDLINPATEDIYARVAMGDTSDVDKAACAARAAFASWAARPMGERVAIMRRFVDLYRENAERLTVTVTREMGAPVKICRSFLVDENGNAAEAFVDLAESYQHEQPINGALVIREAYGVVGAITPWNNPLIMMVDKAVPAMLAGCTVVQKPATQTSVDVLVLAELLEEAGLPKGVYNVVPGAGSVVGQAIIEHPEVDLVSFTGSTGGGRRIAEAAAKGPKKAVLELGGKSACIVLDDFDPRKAAEVAAGAIFSNSGQLCAAWSRLLVPRSSHKAIVEALVAHVNAMKIGDPEDPDTDLGPVVSAKQKQTVTDYIRVGIKEGATLAVGGPETPDGLEKGYYVKPTVFDNVDNSMRIAREEIFGPVLVVIPYDDVDDAVRIANDSEYGLHGGVLSNDHDRALSVAKRMSTGQIGLNAFAFHLTAPFGGYRMTGYGRCMGPMGYEEFLQTKAVIFEPKGGE